MVDDQALVKSVIPDTRTEKGTFKTGAIAKESFHFIRFLRGFAGRIVSGYQHIVSLCSHLS